MSTPKLTLEELKRRLDNAQPVNVDQDGRISPVDLPKDKKKNNQPLPDGTVVKPTRWFGIVSRTVNPHIQWYDQNPARLTLEKQIMEKKFPSFALQMMADGSLAWHGQVQTESKRYQIAVIYPPDFPRQPPNVYPVDPQIEVRDVKGNRLKHQYNDGHLCLYYPADRSFHAKTTATTVIAVAALWFNCYEYWLKSGKKEWPGDEAD